MDHIFGCQLVDLLRSQEPQFSKQRLTAMTEAFVRHREMKSQGGSITRRRVLSCCLGKCSEAWPRFSTSRTNGMPMPIMGGEAPHIAASPSRLRQRYQEATEQ